MHLRSIRLPAFALVMVLLAGCLGTPSGESGPRRGGDVISREQIVASTSRNAYDVVQGLRPQWLRPRGTFSFETASEVVLYVDAVRSGTVEDLRTLPSETVEYIQWLDPASATQRWGTGHASGVVLVVTRRPG